MRQRKDNMTAHLLSMKPCYILVSVRVEEREMTDSTVVKEARELNFGGYEIKPLF